MILEREYLILPVDTTAAMPKGTILGNDAGVLKRAYDSVNSVWALEPMAVLAEDVSAGQTPAKAKVLVKGVLYKDEIAADDAAVINDDVILKLIKNGIIVKDRVEA